MPKNPRLKVGLVFDDSLDNSDGVAQYVKTLGGWLNRQGHEVGYLVGQTKTKEWQGGKIFSLSSNVSVRFNGNKLSMPLRADKQKIGDVVGSERFDVLHVMLPCSPLMAGRVVAKADDSVAILGTFHIFPSGWLSKIGSRLLAIILRPTIKRMNEIVSVSQPAQFFAKKSYGIESNVLPNPVAVKDFIVPISEKKYNKIVFLGRLVERKGCRQLIEAFTEVTYEMPDVRLIIAGDGPQRQKLEKLVHSLGINEKVEFLGYIKESDKAGLLGSATIACFPSLFGESFGIVLVEAMAAGAEVIIGGENPGYRSVLGEKPSLLINPNDRQQFSRRLIYFLQDKESRQDVRRWMSDKVKQYDIENIGPKVIEKYMSSIDKASKNSHN